MSAVAARPEFHDESLKEALEESAPAIENFTSSLDRLSEDIKSLEDYLDRSAVRVPTTVRFPAPEDEDDEYLSWTKGEPDRWRIIYHRLPENSRSDQVERVDKERRVLIEAPLDVRVRARRILPMLLRAVADVALLGEKGVPRKNKKRGWDEAHHTPPTPAASPPSSDDDIPF